MVDLCELREYEEEFMRGLLVGVVGGEKGGWLWEIVVLGDLNLWGMMHGDWLSWSLGAVGWGSDGGEGVA